MTKFKKALIVFAVLTFVALSFAKKSNASIINTINVNIQNPPAPLPPAPPKKPEPPLPPNIPTPIPTRTPSPTITPTPSSTPDPGDKCTNIDGFQATVPDGWFQISPDSRFCRQFQYGGPQNGGSGGSTGGQVLGAKTMAGTGSFDENLYMVIMTIGGTISTFALKNLKKAIQKA